MILSPPGWTGTVVLSPRRPAAMGEWQLQPLSFETLRHFFPTWNTEERIALYSIVGGVPAYLSWLDPNRSLEENLTEVMLSPGSMFLAEPQLLLYDQLRELGSYLAVLRAIADGQHALSAISRASMISRTSLMFYLSRLQAGNHIGRDPAVGTADPEIIG